MNYKLILERHEINHNERTTPGSRCSWQCSSNSSIPDNSRNAGLTNFCNLTTRHNDNDKIREVYHIENGTSDNSFNIRIPLTAISQLLSATGCTPEIIQCHEKRRLHTNVVVSRIPTTTEATQRQWLQLRRSLFFST